MNRLQLVQLSLLTLIWGLNWPMMKLGVSSMPGWTFRLLSMSIGMALLGLWLLWRKTPMRLPRAQWSSFAKVCLTNSILWHVLAIMAVAHLSSGRSAVLAYTMPIFAALYGRYRYGQRLDGLGWLGILASALGVLLLLANELEKLSGSLGGVLLMLLAAMFWGIGTQQLRHTHLDISSSALSFWFFLCTSLVLLPLAFFFERQHWQWPNPSAWLAVLYNAVLIFAFVHVIWFELARHLPAIASSLSTMLIPVLGVYSGAYWLHEQLFWQDHTAIGLMLVSILSVFASRMRSAPAS